MIIDISKIKVNTRIRRDLGDIDELAESIEVYGLLFPIAVRKVNEESYKLLAGYRRLKACKQLGKTEIDVMVIKE